MSVLGDGLEIAKLLIGSDPWLRDGIKGLLRSARAKDYTEAEQRAYMLGQRIALERSAAVAKENLRRGRRQ